MTSDDARDLFSAFYDGEVGDDDRAAFEAALAGDDELRREWEGFRELLNETHALDEELAGDEPDLLAGVQNKLRTRSRGRFYKDRYSQSSAGGLLPILMAAVMLLVIVVAWLMLQRVTIEPPASGELGALIQTANG